ncbi:MAG: hypothetical protein IJ287_02195 [Methanobrevibacter sp.]|nr:hypothetical protein [Methanobrevibacter sp.]
MNCDTARKITVESRVKKIINMCPVINPAHPKMIGVLMPNLVARRGPTKLKIINASPPGKQ